MLAWISAVLLGSPAFPQRLLLDIVPGREPSRPLLFTPFRDVVLFAAHTVAEGYELWRTDGTAAGTYALTLCPGPQPGWHHPGVTVVGDLAVFHGSDGTRTGLFATDGTRNGARFLAAPLVGGQPPNSITPMVVLGNRGYFSVLNPNGGALYVTDGTAAGTVALHTWSTIVAAVAATSTHVFFLAGNGGHELWATDGTPAGLRRLTSWSTSWPRLLVRVGDRLFFREEDTSLTTRLWVTDGTPAGTAAVAGFPTAYVLSIADLGGQALVLASPVDGAVDLWRTDGTSAGTSRVVRVVPSPNATIPSFGAGHLLAADDLVYLMLNGPNQFRRLWRTDGTAAGTFEFHPLGFLLRIIGGLTPVGSRIVFSSLYGIEGYEPWLSDGSQAGTRILADLFPGAGDSLPDGFTVASGLASGPSLLFSATDPSSGIEPWIVPLAAVGAGLLAPVHPGCAAAGPVPRLERSGAPSVGNLGFGVRVQAHRANAPVALLVAVSPGIRVAGCAALLPADVVSAGTTGADGAARFSLPVPPDPSLVGARLFLQPAVPVAGGFVLGIADLGPVAALVVGA